MEGSGQGYYSRAMKGDERVRPIGEHPWVGERIMGVTHHYFVSPGFWVKMNSTDVLEINAVGEEELEERFRENLADILKEDLRKI